MVFIYLEVQKNKKTFHLHTTHFKKLNKKEYTLKNLINCRKNEHIGLEEEAFQKLFRKRVK